MVADLVGVFVAFLVSLAIFPSTPSADTVRPAVEVLVFALSLPAWILLLRMYGLYSRDGERTDHSTVDDFAGILQAVTIGSWLFILLSFVTGLIQPQIERVAVFWIIAISLVSILRIVARAACRSSASYVQNAVILGAGSVGQQIAAKIMHRTEYGLNLVGFVDDGPALSVPISTWKGSCPSFSAPRPSWPGSSVCTTSIA